jgi:hypothetical protein
MPSKVSKQILKQVARLESVERRWLGSVFASLFLAAFILVLAIDHVEMGHLWANEPAVVPAIQFLLILVSSAIIMITSLAAIIDYFAFELHVERQVVITKKRRRTPTVEEESEDED